MLHKKILGAAALCAALIAGPAFAQQNSNQLLLNLLIKKGILTQQEADSLQQEASMAPAAPATSTTTTTTVTASAAPVIAGPGSKSPLAFQIGNTAFTPVGFMDFTTVYRSTNTGGSIGSGFSSIPFNNAAAGQLSETRFSAQNSRVGLRVDSNLGDTKVLGYLESDFLGAGPTNQNVTSNSDALRMRVYFVDLRRGDWEFLAGQDWSMMTPNRKGLSPMPSDIFYSQNVDTNYQNGLIWARQPQVRAIYHPTSEWALGVSLENPDQYVGSGVTLPAGFNAASVDNGSNGTATPNLVPDVIAKVAYDTKLNDTMPFHIEAAGLFREFKVNTLTTGANPVNANDSANGAAGSINADLGLMPSLHLIGNVFGGKGGGRYIANDGAPDFIVQPANSSGVDTIKVLSSNSYLAGLEWDAVPTDKLFGYYSIADIGRAYTQISATGYVGYGYPGSANSNNKSVEEYTVGNAWTIWKDAAKGDLKFLAQASYVDRKPWYVAPNTPTNAHLGMFFLDVRYDLP
jgi:hypothetical protein